MKRSCGLFVLVFLACGDDDGTTTQHDAAVAIDGSANDAATIDAIAAPPDFIPDANCEYLEAAQLAMSCEGLWTSLWEMHAVGNARECPDWVRYNERAFANTEHAAISLSCELDCVYRANSAALLVYCGVKGEMTTYQDGFDGQTEPDDSCQNLLFYETMAGSGYYYSFEEFEAATPCPS